MDAILEGGHVERVTRAIEQPGGQRTRGTPVRDRLGDERGKRILAGAQHDDIVVPGARDGRLHGQGQGTEAQPGDEQKEPQAPC